MAEKKAILLRIPPELWESLNRWARDDLRSVNAQIEFVLRDAVRKRFGGLPLTPLFGVKGEPPAEDAALEPGSSVA